jgi:hypothetical protein
MAACHEGNGQIGTDSTPPIQQQQQPQKQASPQNHAHMQNNQASDQQQQQQKAHKNAEDEVCRLMLIFETCFMTALENSSVKLMKKLRKSS